MTGLSSRWFENEGPLCELFFENDAAKKPAKWVVVVLDSVQSIIHNNLPN